MDPEKAVLNQGVFREVNERIRGVNPLTPQQSDFVCECASTDCTEIVTLQVDDYDEIRRVSTHFLVKGDTEHVFPETEERIFAKREGYFVVEKFGQAGVIAVTLDVRRPPVES